VTRGALPYPFTHNVSLIWGNAGRTWRPAVGVLFRGTWIYSFHAISPGGGDAPYVLNQIDAASAGVTWRVGGDFNRSPASLDRLIPDDMVVCPPNAPTHPNQRPTRKLDYFVCEGDYDDEVEGQVSNALPLSDHRAVYYTF
jgi:cytolethal distending toxin subunit B